MNQSYSGWYLIIGVFVFCYIVGSCNKDSVQSLPVKNDYQDMRNRGHSEEDAVIFSILKQQGFSDYDALNATKSSK
jgi:hypothetical protein